MTATLFGASLLVGCGSDGEILGQQNGGGAAGSHAGAGGSSSGRGGSGASGGVGGSGAAGGKGGTPNGAGAGSGGTSGHGAGSGGSGAVSGSGGRTLHGGQGGADAHGGMSASGTGGGQDGSSGGAAGEAGGAGASGSGSVCGGSSGVTCPNFYVCHYADGQCGAGDAEGTCTTTGNVFCTPLPVCSCNGKAYSNVCRANSEGVDITQDKACVPGDGTAGDACFVDGDCSGTFKCCTSPIGVMSCTTPGSDGQCIPTP